MDEQDYRLTLTLYNIDLFSVTTFVTWKLINVK